MKKKDLVDLLDPKPRRDLPPEGNYELKPERVVSLDKKLYSKDAAHIRFRQIARKQKLIVIEEKETARHYIWFCLYRR